jgi:hypothetical protein
VGPDRSLGELAGQRPVGDLGIGESNGQRVQGTIRDEDQTATLARRTGRRLVMPVRTSGQWFTAARLTGELAVLRYQVHPRVRPGRPAGHDATHPVQ